MIDRIHINDLRRMVEATTGDLREIVAALGDVAEAAQAVRYICLPEDETESDLLTRLDAALARFDFGEGANR